MSNQVRNRLQLPPCLALGLLLDDGQIGQLLAYLDWIASETTQP